MRQPMTCRRKIKRARRAVRFDLEPGTKLFGIGNLGLLKQVHFWRLARDLKLLGDDSVEQPCVGGALDLEFGLALGQVQIDSVAFDSAGPLPIGGVDLRPIGMVGIAGLAASSVTTQYSAAADEPDPRQMYSQRPIAILRVLCSGCTTIPLL